MGHRSSEGIRRAAPLSWIQALAVGLAALALGALVAIDPAVPALLVACTLAAFAYGWLAGRIGIALALLLPLLLAGLLVPIGVSAAAQLGLAVLAAGLAAAAFLRRDPLAWPAIAALAVVGVWMLLTLNPNVPSLSVGLVGVRKTTFVFVGLAIGLLWPRGSSADGERLIVRMLCVAGLAALGVHLYLPGLEDSFARGASIYTEQFAGGQRMAGFFAGPFHVSLLGAFLVLWAWHAYLANEERRWLVVTYAITGALLLAFADVRTGFLVAGLGVAITLLLRPAVRGSRLKVAAATAFAAGACALLLTTPLLESEAASSLPHLAGDSRVASRVDTLRASGQMVGEAPLLGWGAGSAGSTLADEFRPGRHVTSHNMALGLLVEGGAVGLLLVGLVLLVTLRRADGLGTLGHPAAAAGISLAGFGLAGQVSEALPISLFLMMLLGLRARASREPGRTT